MVVVRLAARWPIVTSTPGAGVRLNLGRGAFTFSTSIGGGDAPSAGAFTAIDGGASVGFDNCYVVPIASASAFARSRSPRARSTSRLTPTRGRLRDRAPHRRCRIDLSPSTSRARQQAPWLTVGFDVTTVVEATEDAELFGLGAGIAIPL